MDGPQDPVQDCSPTLLWLGQAPNSPYRLDPSLVKGTSKYKGSSADEYWPTFPATMGHRLHDIKTICAACRSINLHHLFDKSHEISLHKNFLTIQKTAASCRLCALIAQVTRGAESFKSKVDFRNSLVRQNCGHPGPVKVAVRGAKLEIWIPHPKHWSSRGDTVNRWVLGTFQVRLGKDGQDTSLIPSGGSQSDQAIIEDLRRIITSASCTQCQTDHLGLGTSALQSSKPPQLPDRVIEIIEESSDKFTLRLLSTYGSQRGHYITLSHRWGGSFTLKTTKNTLSDRAKGFAFKDLPRTFRDVVVVAKAMGILYVWIDSLCIVQDDEQEWLGQSVKMGSIYANSTFTIAAHSASQCNEGFLWRGQVSPWLRISPVSQLPGLTPLMDTDDDFEYGFEVLLPHLADFDLRDRFVQSEIARRAWILQELTLSPRILHFVENYLLWECEHKSPEIGGFPIETTATVFRHIASNETDSQGSTAFGIYTNWLKLVSRYTAYQMTKTEDKLIALAGITRVWPQFVDKTTSQVRKEEHHCGVFQEDIERSLLWYNCGKTATKLHMERAPTWSWASVDGEVDFLHLELLDDATLTKPLIQVLKVNHEDFNAPKESLVLKLSSLCTRPSWLSNFIKSHSTNILPSPTCRLTIKAPFMSITGAIEVARSQRLQNTPEKAPRWMAAITNREQYTTYAWLIMDRNRGSEPQTQAYKKEETTNFVAISGRRGKRIPERIVGAWCIVVKQSRGVIGAYQRIGMGYVRDKEIVNDAMKSLKEITLI